MTIYKTLAVCAMISPLLYTLMWIAGVLIMIPFTGGPYMGLVERFMVSGYQIFYFVSGLFIFLRN